MLVKPRARDVKSVKLASGGLEFHAAWQGCGGVAPCCDFEILGTPGPSPIRWWMLVKPRARDVKSVKLASPPHVGPVGMRFSAPGPK